MARKRSPKQLEARLRTCRDEYDRLKAQIHDVGFTCEGSLLERWMPCRKPNCRCAADPPQLHGPYFQLTWKERGKTRCRNLPPEHARLYREWVANRRELDGLLKRMKKVSQKAGRYLLDAATDSSDASSIPPKRSRSRRSNRS